MTDRTSEFFHSYAGDFDAIYGNDNRGYERVINRLFRHARAVRYAKSLEACQPVTGRSVIDIGCGPGHYGVALARQGASRVLGLDFAPGMLEIAKKRADAAGVGQQCSFVNGDFLTYPFSEKFDYAILMGFMDYIADAPAVIARALQITRRRAVFSFPADGGPLAWQRKLRYRNRCDLYLYRQEQIQGLFSRTGEPFKIEPIGRDFFVTLEPRSSS
jgi:SAM-dependent methyltransferase